MSTTTLTARLQEAETALHQLATGALPRVVVDQNGERVEFTGTNMDRLRAYIAELKAQIGVLPVARPPIGFLF